MASGNIYIHKVSDLEPIKCLKYHADRLNEVKFSPYSNYFASSDLSGHVMVWLFRTFQNCVEWDDSSTCLIEWHPWNESNFLIGSTSPGTISLINLVSKKVVAYYQRFDDNFQLDAFAFNRISGELVVSFLVPDLSKHLFVVRFENNVVIILIINYFIHFIAADDGFSVEILVLASMNRVVDTLVLHENRVRFLMWNPDGTQLGNIILKLYTLDFHK